MARDRKRAKQRQRQRAGREPAPAKPDSGRGEPAEGGVEVEGLPAADEPVSVGTTICLTARCCPSDTTRCSRLCLTLFSWPE